MKFYQFGRSMVEMLGVLARIGVLSVGALSGYSTAMNKYKLNKQAEQISLLFNTAIKYLNIPNAVQCSSVYECDFTSILWKLNEIPENMKGSTTPGRYGNIYDSLNVQYYVYSTRTPSVGIRVYIENNQYGKESCLNILQTAKSFYNDISDLQFMRGTSETSGWQWFLYGGKGTGSNKLKDLQLADIQQRCAVCDAQSTNCYMNIIFK